MPPRFIAGKNGITKAQISKSLQNSCAAVPGLARKKKHENASRRHRVNSNPHIARGNKKNCGLLA